MTASMLALTLIVSAPALKDKPVPDLPLVGRWMATKLLVNGKQDPQWEGLEYEFKNGGVWVIYRNSAEVTGGPRSYNVDLKGKSAAIDLTEGGADAKPMPGIYEVSGDTLTVSFQIGGGSRPKDFTETAGLMILTMTRVKTK